MQKMAISDRINLNSYFAEPVEARFDDFWKFLELGRYILAWNAQFSLRIRYMEFMDIPVLYPYFQVFFVHNNTRNTQQPYT